MGFDHGGEKLSWSVAGLGVETPKHPHPSLLSEGYAQLQGGGARQVRAGILKYDTAFTAKKSVNRFIRITLPAGTPFLQTNNNIIFKPTTVDLAELVFNGSRFLFSSFSTDFNKTIHVFFDRRLGQFYISIEDQSFPLYFRNPDKAKKMFPLSLLLKS
ncbi:MAG: hypothetical protein QXP96_04940 [Thermoproteota archaeon]